MRRRRRKVCLGRGIAILHRGASETRSIGWAVCAAVAALAVGNFSAPAAPPVIDVWYGPEQTFGSPGVAQHWVNILGNVHDPDFPDDPDEIDTLTYTLNGGPAQPLSIGSDKRRLYYPGDFNIDIDFADLLPGTNGLVITATDDANETTVANVTIHHQAGQVAPLPLTIDWSTVTNVQDVAQAVDGEWTVENGALRAPVMGYDRVIAFGDVAWTDYEVTTTLTLLDLDSNGFLWPSVSPGVGFTLRWPGHSDNPVVCPQPRCGWLPSGATLWYEPGTDGPLWLAGDDGLDEEQDRALTFGVPYAVRFRVESRPGEGTFYAAKVWEAGTPEPTDWDMSGLEDLNDVPAGSCILVAHHVDLLLGDVVIEPLAGDPAPVVSGIQVTADATSALIAWNTNEPTTGFVEYGPTAAYEVGTVSSDASGTLHNVLLSGLTTGQTYHYRITAVDVDSNATTTSDAVFTAQGDDDPPIISAVSAAPAPTFATVTWLTDEPADTRVRYGTTPAYGLVASNGLPTTDHGITLSGLTPETMYHFEVESRDAEGNVAVSTPASFVTPPAATPVLVSDHFNQAALDTAVWTWVDPAADGSSHSLTGQQLRIAVPATGVDHELWTNGLFAPRIMQPAPDTDFEIEARFDSPLTQNTQIQGLLVQESPIHVLRAEFHYVAGRTRVFVATVAGETATVHRHVPATLTPPMHLRIGRTGDQWRVHYSLDGQTWTLVQTFSEAMTVTAVGLQAGNDADTPHTMLVDYFRDTSDPHFLADCNLNGTADGGDISAGTSADCNVNGIPDECELAGNDCNTNGVPDACDLDLNSNGSPDDCEHPGDCDGNGILDVDELAGNDCDSNGVLDACDPDCNTNGVPDACETLADCDSNGTPDTCEASVDCNDSGVPDRCELAGNDCDSNGVPDECDVDCDSNGTPDACEIFADCNGNGVPDGCELAGNDCDSNGVPDACDPDCNSNGTPDACEALADCNGNGIPDGCELSGNDCDSNGVPDACDPDCNSNGTPDACEALADCNTNGHPDVCEIAAGTAPDDNLDGMPDTCQVLNLTSGGAYPSIAAALNAAVGDDVLLSPAGFFLTEPTIDFAGHSVRLHSDGAIVQPPGGALSPADESELLAAIGSDIELYGQTTIGSIDDVAFTADAFRLHPGGSFSVGASATAEIHTAATVQLGGSAQVLPQGLIAADADITIAGDCSVFGGTIAAPRIRVADPAGTLTAFGNVSGDLHNDADLLVIADLQIVGDFTNQAVTTLQNGTLTVLGTLINEGEIIGDLSRGATHPDAPRAASDGMFIRGDWVSDRTAALMLPEPDWSVRVGGAFRCAIDNYRHFELSRARLEMAGDGTAVQTFEVMSTDIGAGLDGLTPGRKGHYPVGTVRIGPTPTVVRLDDRHLNAPDTGLAECLYVDHLVVEAGATLVTNGLRIYYRTKEIAGAVDQPNNLIPLVVVAGDCNGDGAVTVSDAAGMTSCLGGPGGMPAGAPAEQCPCATFDFDGDDDVDLADFAALQRHIEPE